MANQSSTIKVAVDFLPLIKEVIRDCQVLADNLRQEQTHDLLQLENMLWSTWTYSQAQMSQLSQSANMTGGSSHNEGIRFFHDVNSSEDALMDVDDESQVCIKYLKVLLAYVSLRSPPAARGNKRSRPVAI